MATYRLGGSRVAADAAGSEAYRRHEHDAAPATVLEEAQLAAKEAALAADKYALRMQHKSGRQADAEADRAAGYAAGSVVARDAAGRPGATRHAEENAAGLAAATAVMAGNRQESAATQKHARRAQEEAVRVVDAKYKKPMP